MFNIAFICDDNFVLPTSVAVASLIHSNSDKKLTIHIITPGVSKSAKDTLKTMETPDAKIEIYAVENDFLSISTSELFAGIPANHTALMKFNLPLILSDVDKLLYLDGDLIVKGDISGLYNIDFGDNIVAGVYDNIADWHMKSLGVTKYFNSGVMLLNLKKMREENYTQRLIDYRCNGFNRFMDQDTFNAVFKGKVIFADFKYNTMYSILEMQTVQQIKELYGFSSVRSVDELVDDAVVVHFSSSKKPWKYVLPGLSMLYRYYLELSPYKGYAVPYIGKAKKLCDPERYIKYYSEDSSVLVSIIIPARNVKETIDDCVGSLTSQTLKDIEIIIVDDASTDETPAMLDEYSAKDSRIKVIHCEKNVGTCMARRLGVQASTGKFIMFVDGDDKIKHNACENLYHAMVENDVDIIQFKTEIVSNGSDPAVVNNFEKYINASYEFLTGEEIIEKSFVKKTLSRNLWNRIYKGDLVRESLADLDEGYYLKSEDLYTSLLIAFSAKNMAFVDGSYYIYSMGLGITSTTSEISVSKFNNLSTGIDVAYCIAKFVSEKHHDEKYLPLLTTIFKHCFTENSWWLKYVSAENIDECLEICFKKYEKLFGCGDDVLVARALAESVDIIIPSVIGKYFEIVDLVSGLLSSIDTNSDIFDKYSNLYHNFALRDKKTVNIAININNADFQYLTALLESIRTNKNPDAFYNVYVFGNGIYNKYLDRMKRIESDSMSLRFVTSCTQVSDDIRRGMDGNLAYKLYAINFLEFVDRVIYMSYDSIMADDITELMNIELDGKIIAAPREYSQNTGEATGGFSNNLLVIDRCALKRCDLRSVYFEKSNKMSEKEFLNSQLNNKVKHIEDKWCFQWHIPYKYLGGKITTDYSILHWGSADKPWRSPQRAYAEVFWKYARNTDFYEEILYENLHMNKDSNRSVNANVPEIKRTLWQRFKIGCRDIGFFATVKKAIKKAFKKVFRKRG